MVFLGILVAILMFSIVVLVHEYGHFSTARFFGVKVEEFGLGIPPRAKKLWTDKKGTLFSLNWLPLGGFVKIAGETPTYFNLYNKKGIKYSQEEIQERIKSDKKLYDSEGESLSHKEIKLIQESLKENTASYNLSQKPAWQQSIIILAGVFMNFLLASFIFAILFFVGVKPIGINDTIKIDNELKLVPTLEQAIENGIIEKKKGVYLYPLEDSLAAKSGIQEGDLLLRINDTNFSSITEVQDIIGESKDTEATFYIERTSECPPDSQEATVCPIVEYMEILITPSVDGRIGSYLSENLSINEDFTYNYSVIDSAKYGVLETYGHAKLTLKALGYLGKKILFPETQTQRQEAVDQLSGPIGIVDFISNSLAGGIIFLVIIGAIISVNLGVFNLLPIPALDGGRFLFIILNASWKKITGKNAIPQKVEATIHITFFALLIALSFLIAYNDILKIFNK